MQSNVVSVQAGESYIDWARKNLVDAKFNLGRSGLPPLTPEEFDMDFSKLPVTVENFAFLREYENAIAERYGANPDGVVSANGSSHANMLAAMAFVKPGDNVVVEQPAYEPLITLFGYFGVEIRRLPRRPESGFIPDPDELAEIIDSRTRLVVLTNPHNPTAAFYGNDIALELAEVMASVDGYVLVDEIYLDYYFDNTPTPAGMLAPNIVTTSSLTKVYGLGTFRAGWVMTAPETAAVIRRGIDYSIGNPSFPSCMLATLVFKNLAKFSAISRNKTETNRAVLKRFLDSTPEIECVMPAAGIVAFPRIKSEKFDSLELFHYLLSKFETTIVPGRFFDGMNDHFRLCVGPPPTVIEPGLESLRHALKELSG